MTKALDNEQLFIFFMIKYFYIHRQRYRDLKGNNGDVYRTQISSLANQTHICDWIGTSHNTNIFLLVAWNKAERTD